MRYFSTSAFSILLLFTSCTATMTAIPTPANLPAFDMQGHRGARGLMPENTIPAMLAALALGVTTLEMDVHISQDGQVLLSHDPYMNPEHELLPDGSEIPASDAGKYVLYAMNYSDIRQFDVGSMFYSRFPEQQLMKIQKPLLADVIDSVQAYLQKHQLPQVFYNIETKSKPETDGKYHPAPEEFVQRLMEVIEKKGMKEWVVVQSFDVRTLRVLHTTHPEVKTSLLVENEQPLEQNIAQLGFVPNIYSPDEELVTPDLVEATHQHGMKLIPWTVNDLERMRQLKRWGVDGIISDYPNLFNKL